MYTADRSLRQPSLHKGWEIFASRPFSLVAALIFAVVLSVISFFILFFPVITGYYYAIRQSEREAFFIDLKNVFRTTFLVLQGVGRYFFQSFIMGIFGLIPSLILLLLPVLLFQNNPHLALISQVLFLPAFFIAGAVVLFGYPYLLATNRAFGALGYALSTGKRRPLTALGIGFLILCPIPGAIFHLLMVLSYPVLAASAVATTADKTDKLLETPVKEKTGKFGFAAHLVILAVFAVGGYYCFQLIGGPGIVFILGLFFAFELMTALISLRFALKIFIFIAVFVGITLGGGTLCARIWGDSAFMVWVVICVVLLMIFQKRIFAGSFKPK